jgi:hypothetical protein
MDTFKKLSNDFEEDEEERFINSDKVTSIINVLTKYKIKLWELPDLNGNENKSQTEVKFLKIYIFKFKKQLFHDCYLKGSDNEVIR